MPNNPQPYDEDYHTMCELNKHEDTLDVFINLVMKRSPTVFILANMTLMIWMVQMIFSSNLDSIPRSIYLWEPFLSQPPITGIRYLTADSNNEKCYSDEMLVSLKNFPTFYEEHITHISQMPHWGTEDGWFCVTRMPTKSSSLPCQEGMIQCSGYCVTHHSQCPITNIKKLHSDEQIPAHYQPFINSTSSYIFTRQEGMAPVVGLLVTYPAHCSNDNKYFDVYDTFVQYWKQTKKCDIEGVLPPTLFEVVDEMDSREFLEGNGVNNGFVLRVVQGTKSELGLMRGVSFQQGPECSAVESKMPELQSYLFDDPVKPAFTESLLVIAFIFFTACWAWLMGFYCFEGKRKEKNIMVVLMAIVEIIVIGFIYSQNIKLFQTSAFITHISSCLNTSIEAANHWDFGIQSNSPFLMILYISTCFLSLQAIAHLFDNCIYQPYYSY